MSEPQKRGGQRSAPSLEPSSAPPSSVVADRIDTPDATSVDAVMTAVSAIEREKAMVEARRKHHMSDCGIHRGSECHCPANLAQLPDAMERVVVDGHPFIRVDDGRYVPRERPDPQNSARVIKFELFEQPRWICTDCGVAMRVPGLIGHACDPAFLLFKQRPIRASLTLPSKVRFKGAYRLTIWRDLDGTYHLAEVIVQDGKVVIDTELVADNDYNTFEAALSDALAQEFAP